MSRTSSSPNGREISFGDDELIVSKTDPQGHITYANDVFCRVSGFSAAELIGQAHNLIRHPGMPRAVFKLLRDTAQSGEEVFAFRPAQTGPNAPGRHGPREARPATRVRGRTRGRGRGILEPSGGQD